MLIAHYAKRGRDADFSIDDRSSMTHPGWVTLFTHEHFHWKVMTRSFEPTYSATTRKHRSQLSSSLDSVSNSYYLLDTSILETDVRMSQFLKSLISVSCWNKKSIDSPSRRVAKDTLLTAGKLPVSFPAMQTAWTWSILVAIDIHRLLKSLMV